MEGKALKRASSSIQRLLWLRLHFRLLLQFSSSAASPPPPLLLLLLPPPLFFFTAHRSLSAVYTSDPSLGHPPSPYYPSSTPLQSRPHCCQRHPRPPVS
ncbi:hypothetical protein BO70DRAFT_32570 [Aspergillus heteromorphus CBS 117.55]|uniref:Uncharacterized protein n=1 Tax=Aspergillus heteromorphus CBS 117.55 TaxID=1448321 RepID=A0A317WD38_9EURO|nr:uncharacterized protein BO70DRAFT_32570 [Aspergillus heteromorphus CBS 117.55]PWY82948.1 hypothetical protein BO70DRAFT_32570 [Aspergillus heteromorphus CBS 117.55]